MRLELDDVSVYMAKNNEDLNITMSEKMTQTDFEMFDRDHSFDLESEYYKTAPNGTSPCNHPSLSCQVTNTAYNVIVETSHIFLL